MLSFKVLFKKCVLIQGPWIKSSWRSWVLSAYKCIIHYIYFFFFFFFCFYWNFSKWTKWKNKTNTKQNVNLHVILKNYTTNTYHTHTHTHTHTHKPLQSKFKILLIPCHCLLSTVLICCSLFLNISTEAVTRYTSPPNIAEKDSRENTASRKTLRRVWTETSHLQSSSSP